MTGPLLCTNAQLRMLLGQHVELYCYSYFLGRTSAHSCPARCCSWLFYFSHGISLDVPPSLFTGEFCRDKRPYKQSCKLRKSRLFLFKGSIVKFSCICMLNYMWMMQKNDLPKSEGFSYPVVHLKGRGRWGLLVSHLNFEKDCETLYNRQAASMGSDLLHMISGSEFVCETSHVTSSQVQYSNGECWMNSCPGVPWWILISKEY